MEPSPARGAARRVAARQILAATQTNRYLCLTPHATPQSAVEETLARIALMGGVEGFIITDGDGVILRQSKTFSSAAAMQYATEVLALTKRARHVVRDIDPKVRGGARGGMEGCRAVAAS